MTRSYSLSNGIAQNASQATMETLSLASSCKRNQAPYLAAHMSHSHSMQIVIELPSKKLIVWVTEVRVTEQSTHTRH